MASGKRLLIAGGYGVVGRRVARQLAPLFESRVVIAGRHLAQAQALAAAIGHGATARQLDVDDWASVEAAIAGVDVVLSCVGQPRRLLLRAAAKHGLGYSDTAPYLVKWRDGDEFVPDAERSGARIILGTGLAPGVSNVMAAAAVARVGQPMSIESAVLLGSGNEHGADSGAFLYEEASRAFAVMRDGQQVTVRPFSEATLVRFPEPLNARKAYLFPFSDVVLYPRTLGVKTAISRLAIDPPSAGALLAGLIAMRAPVPLLSALARVVQLKRHRPATFGLCIVATGSLGMARYSISGINQAAITAFTAGDFARGLMTGEIGRTGVRCAEEVVPPEPFFNRLAAAGYRIEHGFHSANGG